MGPFQRIRDLVELLRAAQQSAQNGDGGYQPMPPVGSRGGRPALPPDKRPRDKRPRDADEAPDRRARAEPIAPVVNTPSRRRARIQRWLKDPETLSDAIVLREILGPPRAIRGARIRGDRGDR